MTFYQSYVKPLTKDNNLVVFLQDRLSLQDLNHHADVYNPYSDGGSFKNIKVGDNTKRISMI
ncbi:Hypothetical predicted protein [Mytilus galloprovincialis]|uniref:Uncharacterized protein n=1 Tax=Mytilus galloprovincialis TaxID=29158 RepID=A0A8B6DWQ1_MYTGA|nr:Hypothetical predicted protein [Mytilus galloprovincialis]